MFEGMRRLHPRGPASQGIVVDSDGAMLGPDCVLVRRTPEGYHALAQSEAGVLQDLLLGPDAEHDWLFHQSRRIAQALADDHLIIAQILGLQMPIGELDVSRLKRLAALAPVLKANFNPDQPRVPAGSGRESGEWNDEGGGSALVPAAARRTQARGGDPDEFFDTVYSQISCSGAKARHRRDLAARLGGA
ncbi:MAG TPA: hypothetical protein VFC56_16490 [Stellaceae bacterium]|nr:hypothetical protein [Stellaceae bacterium]